ncbi:MAG: hypothetical protein Fur0014_16820 [Rubrivivax sp.]
MQIKLVDVNKNLALETKGPQVEFVLEDQGQALVTMMLSLDDGTVITYPGGGGKSAPQSTPLAPRVYLGVLTVTAASLETFGRSYRSKVRVGGKVLAEASGTIPADQPSDQATVVFQLRVKK